jgi:hypothetical protein
MLITLVGPTVPVREVNVNDLATNKTSNDFPCIASHCGRKTISLKLPDLCTSDGKDIKEVMFFLDIPTALMIVLY